MPTNDFLPFATAGGANVLSQSDYDAAAARSAGVIAGTASSALANKSWRQSSIMAAMLGQFIGDYGALDALDDGDVADLVRDFARSIQRGTFAYVVATGTANAWTVAPTPALAAYAAGRVLNIIAPATNTSTTVNADISTLGNRRIKKADGTDPAVGDLVSGRVYATIDDGTSIRVLTTLPSDTVATIAATAPVGGNWTWSQSLTNNTLSAIGGGSYTAEGTLNLGDATFSGGSLTVGPTSAGLWCCVFTAISTLAGTDIFAATVLSPSSSIGYSTAQTATSAPGISAVVIRRLANGESIFNRCRQVSGGSATITGRFSAIRLGA